VASLSRFVVSVTNLCIKKELMKQSYMPMKLAGGYLVTRTGYGALLDLMSFTT
jgi:hypothetical protein